MNNVQMVKAFNEWMRRYTEEAGRFEAEFRTKDEADGREPSYGETCTAYMSQLATEMPAE